MRSMVAGKQLAGLRSSPRMWLMLGIVGLCVAGFFLVEHAVFADAHGREMGPTPLDARLAHFFEQYRTKALNGRVMEVSALGSAPVLMVLAALAYSVIVRAKDWVGFLHFSVMLLGAGVFSRLLQHLFERARPDNLLPFLQVTEGSFPSAHLFGAAANYVTFACFYARYAKGLRTELAAYVLAMILIALIGVTRVYLGAHHTTDVIAGVCAGCAWAFLLVAIFSTLPQARAHAPRA